MLVDEAQDKDDNDDDDYDNEDAAPNAFISLLDQHSELKKKAEGD